MIFDQTTMLSDRQKINETQPSTHTIDLGERRIPRDIGVGVQIPLLVQVVESFNNLTMLGVRLENSEDMDFTHPKVIWEQSAPLVSLEAGKVIAPEFISRTTNRRYLRLFYTINGDAPSKGAITAGVTMGNQ
ncbi:MAG: hypothetical protein JSC189_001029 [Candidatus Tokpelaia sp. JSC189]|nr:MAG: hypothetical protein JSC189_001029 [Candidatus Tokpelaia sp. JSC189]